MRGRSIAGGVAVAAIVAVAGFFSGCGDEKDEDTDDSSFGRVDADVGAVLPASSIRRYDLGGRPDSISAGAGYVWAADSLAGTLKRINPDSKRPIAVEVAGFPTDVSAGEDAAWLALGDRGAVQRVSGTEGAGEPIDVAGFPFRIAAGEGSVWAMSQTSIEQVDPEAREVSQQLDLGLDLEAIAAGEGAVWVLTTNGKVLKLDPDTGDQSASAEVPGGFNVTVGESAVWALGSETEDGSGGALLRIDSSGAVAGDPVPGGPGGRRRRRARVRLGPRWAGPDPARPGVRAAGRRTHPGRERPSLGDGRRGLRVGGGRRRGRRL